jgi:hypothetical protein
VSQENVEIVIAQHPAFLCTMRKGRILRLTEYQTTADALKAVGLEEEAPATPRH